MTNSKVSGFNELYFHELILSSLGILIGTMRLTKYLGRSVSQINATNSQD